MAGRNLLNEEQMIDLLDEVRKAPNRRELIKAELTKLIIGNDNESVTSIWNLAGRLSETNRISVFEANEIWSILIEMGRENKIVLSGIIDL